MSSRRFKYYISIVTNMPKIPENIQNSFVKLKDEIDGTLVLRNLNGHFYVYRASSRWDKKEKRVRSKQEYIGRINSKGIFIEKSASYEEIELEKARALIEGHGGKVTFDGMPSSVQLSNNQADVDEIDKKILMILSMNARATMPFIAKMTGLSTSAAEYRVKKLEEKFGIKYILELDIKGLGYSQYITFIKFKENIPTSDKIIQAIEPIPNIQFVALTKGEYDVVLFFLAKNNREIAYLIYNLQSNDTFKDYKSEWYTSPCFNDYGFIPVQKFFFSIFKDAIKRRSTNTEIGLGQFSSNEYTLLKELSTNSNMEFAKMDMDYNLVRGATRYTYKRLKERGIIKRATITITKLSIRYIQILFLDVISGAEFEDSRSHLLSEIIESNIFNKYSFASDIEIPYSIMLLYPILYNNEDIDIKTNINNLINGVRIRELIITDILYGLLCTRRFDAKYTGQYELLVDKYQKIKPEKKIIYED